MTTAFTSGNFNKFEDAILNVFPSKLAEVREVILPKIDQVFLSMLGRLETVEAKELNGFFVIEDEDFKGLQFTLSYIVKDFIVPNAPEDAITADCEAIKKAVNAREVTIDVKTGETVLTIYSLIEEDSEDDKN